MITLLFSRRRLIGRMLDQAATRYLLAMLLLIAAGPLRLRAQQPAPALLSGTVVDAETEAPLPGVNVFVAGTTLGAATDEDGVFRIRVPAQHQFEVVASMLGYQVETRALQAAALPPDGLLFRLQAVAFALEGVEVVAERPRAWQQNVDRFTALLFSTTAYGKRCTLLNPDALALEYDDATDVLRATAREPLIVDNEALGYRITIHAPLLIGKVGQVRWGGKIQFSPLEAPNARTRRRWRRNRRRAYEGSERHFLAALVAGRVADEGFNAYFVDRPGVIYTRNPIEEMGLRWARSEMPPVLEDGISPDTWTLRFTGALYIVYTYQGEPREYTEYQNKLGLRPGRPTGASTRSSWITLPRGYTLIDARGNDYGDYMLERFGYWAWTRLGEQLPYDYEPDS